MATPYELSWQPLFRQAGNSIGTNAVTLMVYVAMHEDAINTCFLLRLFLQMPEVARAWGVCEGTGLSGGVDWNDERWERGSLGGAGIDARAYGGGASGRRGANELPRTHVLSAGVFEDEEHDDGRQHRSELERTPFGGETEKGGRSWQKRLHASWHKFLTILHKVYTWIPQINSTLTTQATPQLSRLAGQRQEKRLNCISSTFAYAGESHEQW